jgi:hypothetical protein
MSVKLIALLALTAWVLGPVILRFAGGLLLSAALVMWALPLGTHTSIVTLLAAAVTGAAIRHTGNTWRTHRATARPMPPRLARRWGPAAKPFPAPTDPQTPYMTHDVELLDDDVIDGVAHEVEHLRATDSRGASNRLRRHTRS